MLKLQCSLHVSARRRCSYTTRCKVGPDAAEGAAAAERGAGLGGRGSPGGAPASLEAGAAADSGGLANADAERALLKVKAKLQGVDGGNGEARGVEGQVQQLLHDAQDPDKLCRMYVGWAAWL